MKDELYTVECRERYEIWDNIIEQLEINPTPEDHYKAGWYAAFQFMNERNEEV